MRCAAALPRSNRAAGLRSRGPVAQPGGEFPRVAALGRLRRGEVIVADPGRVGAAVEQQLGGARCPPWAAHHSALSRSSWVAVALASSSRTRSRSPSAAACHRVVPAPRSSSRRAAFHWPKATASAIGVPPPMTARGLDVGAGVEQRVERLDVVAAGRPVQRRLAVRPGEPRVDVGARGDQRPDLRRRLGHVAGPVGDHVQQRLDCRQRARRCAMAQRRVLVEEVPERRGVAGSDHSATRRASGESGRSRGVSCSRGSPAPPDVVARRHGRSIPAGCGGLSNWCTGAVRSSG